MIRAHATRRQWRWVGVATLAMVSLVRPAAAFDPEATFARGTTIFGLQVGGGAANNIEDHRTVSDISFITDALAINAGYRFQHISNGHTSTPNRGFESDSGVVGVSFYFK